MDLSRGLWGACDIAKEYSGYVGSDLANICDRSLFGVSSHYKLLEVVAMELSCTRFPSLKVIMGSHFFKCVSCFGIWLINGNRLASGDRYWNA